MQLSSHIFLFYFKLNLMFYSFIVMKSNKTSMAVNYLVVFFSLFLFTSPTQGKRIVKEIFLSRQRRLFIHRQNNVLRFRVWY